MQIKILSFNIHKGFDWTRRNVTLEKIREAIITTGADLVFLQEVVGENQVYKKKFKEWSPFPQYKTLAGSIWPHCIYGKNAIYEAGHHGNVILSKFPIIQWQQQDISTSRFEQRGILYCNIQLPGPRSYILHAYCLHLDLLHAGRTKQYQAVMQRLLQDVSKSDAMIIAGDFNDWNQKASLVFEQQLHMEEAFKSLHGHYARTFPIYRPFLKLDRIYVKHMYIQKAQVLHKHPWRSLSDHAALYAEISLNQ